MTGNLPWIVREPHAQEPHDIRRAGGVLLTSAGTADRRGDAAQGRELVPGEGHPQDRRMPARRPVRIAVGKRREPGLVSARRRCSPRRPFFPGTATASATRAGRARSTGFWTRAGGRASLRLTWAGREVTPNVRWITSATCPEVHTCPRKPHASDPRSMSASAPCELLGGEPRLPTRCPMAAQPLHTPLAPPLEPLADGARCHAEGNGDVLLFPALVLLLPGASPPPLAPAELGLLRAHPASGESR